MGLFERKPEFVMPVPDTRRTSAFARIAEPAMVDFDLHESEAAEFAAERGRHLLEIQATPERRESFERDRVLVKYAARRDFMKGLLLVNALTTEQLLSLGQALSTPGPLQPYLSSGLAQFVIRFKGGVWLDDLLVFAELSLTKRINDLDTILDATRAALDTADLANAATERYGRESIVQVVRTGLALRHLMLEFQAKQMGGRTDRGGADEWLYREQSIRFLTPALAQLVTRKRTSHETLAKRMWSNPGLGLTLEGIEPAQLVEILSTDSPI